jgi:hypothetical protein
MEGLICYSDPSPILYYGHSCHSNWPQKTLFCSLLPFVVGLEC